MTTLLQEISRKFCYDITKNSMTNLEKYKGKRIRVNFVEQGDNKNKVGVLKEISPFTNIIFSDGDKLPFVDRNIIIRYITNDKNEFVYDKSDIVPKYYCFKGDLGKYRINILGIDSVVKQQKKEQKQVL